MTTTQIDTNLLRSLTYLAHEAVVVRENEPDEDDTPEMVAAHRETVTEAEDVLRNPTVGLETPRMLVLSTAHVTKETALRFQGNWRNELPPFYAKGEYGWIIPLQSDGNGEERWQYCSDLLMIRRLAEANGCTWVMLDRDADVVDALPSYDW